MKEIEKLREHYRYIHKNYYKGFSNSGVRDCLLERLEDCKEILSDLGEEALWQDTFFFLEVARQYVDFRIRELRE